MTKPMRCSNNEFAHEWAYNHERDLRTNCGNMHTRGNTCYSYSTVSAVNDDYVQVGCHRIPVANLNALYREEIDECRDVL